MRRPCSACLLRNRAPANCILLKGRVYRRPAGVGSVRSAVAQRAPVRRCRPGQRLRQGGPYAVDCPPGDVVVGVDQPARVGRCGGAGLPVPQRKTTGPRTGTRDLAQGGRPGRDLCAGIPALAPTRPRFARPRPWRAGPPGLNHPWPQPGGNHQQLLARPARRLQRSLPCRGIEGSNRHGGPEGGHQKGQCCGTGAACCARRGEVGGREAATPGKKPPQSVTGTAPKMALRWPALVEDQGAPGKCRESIGMRSRPTHPTPGCRDRL